MKIRWMAGLLAVLMLAATAVSAEEITDLWQYGGSGSDSARGLLTLADGDLLIYGSTNSTDGDLDIRPRHGKYHPDAWAARLNGDGEILWQVLIGENEAQSEFRTGAVTQSGDIVLCLDKYSNGEYWKSLLWVTAEGETEAEYPLPDGVDFVLPMADGFMLAGFEREEGSGDSRKSYYWFSAVDFDGTERWRETMDMLVGVNPGGGAYRVPDGYLVCGAAASENGSNQVGNRDGFIMKLDEQGQVKWIYRLTYPDAYNLSNVTCLVPLEDGGMVAIGNTGPIEKGSWGVSLRLNAQGSLDWLNELHTQERSEMKNLVATDTGYLALGEGRVETPLGIWGGYAIALDEEGQPQAEGAILYGDARIQSVYAARAEDASLYLYGGIREGLEADHSFLDVFIAPVKAGMLLSEPEGE